MNTMFQDLKYAIRMLLKHPGFTTVVVLTLGFGIGANAALFSVVNGVLLNPLPFPNPDQLVAFHQSKPNFETGAIPYPNFLDLQKENQTFQTMAISRSTGFSLLGAGEPERVRGRMISADFFSVLGIKPQVGRFFTSEDDKSGAAPVALISNRLWTLKFSSSADIIQKSITLDDRSYAVVGVIPADFNLMQGVDVYVPIGQWSSPALKNRGVALGIHGIGRLKPGVTFDQAQADLSRIMVNLATVYPATNKDNGAKVVVLRQQVIGDMDSILWILFGAVGFVLLIACVNVSNLMLARATGRTREFAIRAALGAARSRLLRQSLVESILVALIGGALGLAFAVWGTKAALAALPTALPRAEEVGLDARVLLFTFGVSILTGIVAGLAPALKTSPGRFNATLNEGRRGSQPGSVRAQGIFVAVEMALALVLLVGAGLMVRSLQALWQVDPGFRSENVMSFGLNFPPSQSNATASEVRATLRDVSDKLSAAPGVDAASFLVGAVPLQSEDDLFFWIEGQPTPAGPSEMQMTLFYVVEPGYLNAMGIPLKRGRFFSAQDDERSTKVAVIDEAFARKHFGSEDPLGKRINLAGNDTPSQIVGIVGHVKQFGLDSDHQQSLQAQLYLPFRQLPDNALEGGVGGVGVVVRSRSESGTGSTLFTSIRQIIRNNSGENVISNPQTLDEVISGSLSTQRFSMVLLAVFASIALLLASMGIYGVISYLVGQRTQELGIRIALGAKRSDILRLVLRHGMTMTLVGIFVGLIAAFALTRLMSGMLFGVQATDPLTFATIAVLLAFVALLACFVPARRATKVDPLVALRSE